MTKPELTDIDLETLFGLAKQTAAEPGADFLARLAADAEAAIGAAPQPAVAPVPEQTLWQRVFSWQSLGGFGGMVAATCAGLWIGLSPPEGITDPAAFLLGQDAVIGSDLFDDDWSAALAEEG